MKKIIYSLSAILALAFFASSCDNGNADFDIADVAPLITITDPGSIVQGAPVSITVSFQDGIAEYAISTLASASYTLTGGPTSVDAGNWSLSGRTSEQTVSVPGGLGAGDYTLSVTATDSNGNSRTEELAINVTADFTVGIIGSATPDGWNSDQDLSFVSGTLYEITIDLTAAEAKFRTNDDWAVNWGDTAFPTGTGTQDGPNIPIAAAGTYYVTFDTATGDYSFTLQ